MTTQPKIIRVYTVHAALEPDRISPTIWRRIIVDGNITLSDLHHVLQACFGWEDSGFHEYRDGSNNLYAPAYENGIHPPEAASFFPEDDIQLKCILKNKGDVLRYFYDIWVPWEHRITVKEVKEYEEDIEGDSKKVIVISGANACVPEYIATPQDYQELLDAPNPGSEQTDWAELYGGPFRPFYWSSLEVNAAIARHFNRLANDRASKQSSNEAAQVE